MREFEGGERVTLEALLDAARDAASARGRMIVDVRVDGEPVRREELASASEVLVGGERIDFETADPVEVAASALRDLAGAMEGLREDQRAASDAAAAGDVERAMEVLTGVVGTWDAARRGLADVGGLMGLDLEGMPSEGGEGSGEGSAGACVRGLSVELEEMKRCLGARDWAGLADVLRYELDERALGWSAMLRGLAGEIEGTR